MSALTRSSRTPRRLCTGEREAMVWAAEQLVGCYAALADAGRHLLEYLIDGQQVVQWQHYPNGDVIDRSSGFQYFYHSHPPGERTAGMEHGHFHLFARLDGDWHQPELINQGRLQGSATDHATAHLLAISLDPKGVPRELFTVNQWVTDDCVLSAAATSALLDRFTLEAAGPALVNDWLVALIRLFRPHIGDLLAARDRLLSAAGPQLVWQDRRLEVLSRIGIDIDRRIAELNRSIVD